MSNSRVRRAKFEALQASRRRYLLKHCHHTRSCLHLEGSKTFPGIPEFTFQEFKYQNNEVRMSVKKPKFEQVSVGSFLIPKSITIP
jgi:hypothetical protein